MAWSELSTTNTTSWTVGPGYTIGPVPSVDWTQGIEIPPAHVVEWKEEVKFNRVDVIVIPFALDNPILVCETVDIRGIVMTEELKLIQWEEQ